MNPKGLIPALQHDGRGLYESNILLEYLEDAFPSAPALRPRDPHEAALARLALQFISTTVVPAFFRLMQAQGQEKQDEAKESFVQVLQELYNQWFDKQTGAQWARNDTFGWIEAALAPFLARFPLLAAHRAFSIEMVGPDFSSWAERVLDRPSVRAVLSAPEAYHTIYGTCLAVLLSIGPTDLIFIGRPIQVATSMTRPRARSPRQPVVPHRTSRQSI